MSIPLHVSLLVITETCARVAISDTEKVFINRRLAVACVRLLQWSYRAQMAYLHCIGRLHLNLFGCGVPIGKWPLLLLLKKKPRRAKGKK